MDDIMKAVRNLIEAHKQLFDKFMFFLNVDEYELSWISFFTGVAVTLLISAFV